MDMNKHRKHSQEELIGNYTLGQNGVAITLSKDFKITIISSRGKAMLRFSPQLAKGGSQLPDFVL